MPRQFDMSAVRAHLDSFIREIGDLITSGEETDQYTSFLNALFTINSMTDFHYTPDAAGNFPVLTNAQRTQLEAAYRKAIEEAAPLLTRQETGPAGIAMQGLTRQILPLLQTDQLTLEMAGKEETTLPELIANGRSQIVDFSDQPIPVTGGAMSQRRQITVQSGTTTENGYFTPETTVDPARDYTRLLDDLEKKYPPVYKPIIDAMRKTKPAKLLNQNGALFAGEMYLAAVRDEQAVWKDNVDFYLTSTFYPALQINDELVEELSKRPDFYAFSDEFYTGICKAVQAHDLYLSGDTFLKLRPGANIDKRNVAFSRLAGLFGKGDLVAEARPMTIIQNGVQVKGTFMKEAYGVDLPHIKEGDDILKYKAEAFDNPSVTADIASMQALDFIAGNVDRHLGNFFMRFDPKDPEHAKISGITLIDNDMCFSHATDERHYGNRFILPNEMGVIGEDFYNSLCALTSKEQLAFALRDCGLNSQEIDQAWKRKEILQAKIEADKTYFADKAPGYTEKNRIRIVKAAEWPSYTMKNLGKTHQASQFNLLMDGPTVAFVNLKAVQSTTEKNNKVRQLKQQLGVPVPPEEKPPVPTGKTLFSTAPEGQAPLREDTVKLAIPALSYLPYSGNKLSKRYRISFEENGRTTETFFTPRSDAGIRASYNDLFREAISQNPAYAAELSAIQDYYTATELKDLYIPGWKNIPYKEIGFSEEKYRALSQDKKFTELHSQLASAVSAFATKHTMLEGHGVEMEPGRRIEMRNVATSDVGDLLGLPEETMARSRPVQVLAGNELIDGVIMNRAAGEDINDMPPSHPMKHITAAQADEVYNTAEGMKSLADLQITDYICLNFDRHPRNMLYRFEGLGTDKPKFLGVTGIDNDSSFGAVVPEEDRPHNNLPPLNSIKVISEEMAARILDKDTAKKLEEKLRRDDLSENEVAAAKARLEKIRQKIEKKDIRIVKKDDWAKGPNTLSELSKSQDSLFHTFKRDVIDEMAKEAENWAKLPEDRKEPYVPKTVSFAKSVKVDGFGSEALKKQDFAALDREVEEEFMQRVSARANESPQEAVLTEKDMVQKMHQEALAMEQALKNADPPLHRRSGTYKKLRGVVSDFKSLTRKMSAKLQNPNDALSAADTRKLITQLNVIRDRSEQYNLKKVGEIERGRMPSTVGERRITASTQTSATSQRLQKEYQDVLTAQIAKKGPSQLVHNRLAVEQAALSGLTGEKLRNKVAVVLYYKGLTKLDYGSKEKPTLKNALQPDVVRAERANLRKLPAFKKLEKMNDDELRTLAAGAKADRLLDRFVKEMAKQKQKELLAGGAKKNGPQNEQPQNEQPQAGPV